MDYIHVSFMAILGFQVALGVVNVGWILAVVCNCCQIREAKAGTHPFFYAKMGATILSSLMCLASGVVIWYNKERIDPKDADFYASNNCAVDYI